MLARDHYATLGVPPGADPEAIEQAYRRLIRRYHPDVNPGDPNAAAVYERIEHAYRVLSDAAARERYDREGAARSVRQRHSTDLQVQLLPEGEDGGSFATLFEALREHARRARPPRGDDLYAQVGIPLQQVERGRRCTVSLQRRRPCDACGGRGRVGLQQQGPCGRCNGAGKETFFKGALSISCACADCGGEGLEYGHDCAACHGAGLRGRVDRILVRLPPGVQDGQVIRVRGAGHAGKRGGEPGDLVLEVRVASVPGFARRGPHLTMVLPVTLDEALLGGRAQVPTLDGEPATLRLPPLTQNGSEFRLRGRGLEMSDSRRGDMLVRVEIRIPEILDEDSKEAIRRFAARNPRRSRPLGSTAGRPGRKP